jgi:thiosulfate/3-mercaptopyruvate sulfurtransferase
MAFADNGALVSADWLEAHLKDPGIKILDCTWHHPSTNLDGRTQFRGRHLPSAVHFDIDSVSDPANPLPHMLPSPEDFSKKVGLLGIADGDKVVVYDRQFGASAAGRVWWMFHVFGYENVALLDGGFNKWAKEKRPSDMEPTRPAKMVFTAKPPNLALVRTLAQMKDNLNSRKEQVIDARGPAKFDGTQEDVFTFKKARAHAERDQRSVCRSHRSRSLHVHSDRPDRPALYVSRPRPPEADRHHLRLRHHVVRGSPRPLATRQEGRPRIRRGMGRVECGG